LTLVSICRVLKKVDYFGDTIIDKKVQTSTKDV
jgi:hypothetical protein